MRRSVLGLLSLLSALGLSSCGDGPVTQQSYIRPSGTWSDFQYAGAEGPILVEIRGEPFKGGQGLLEQQVLAALEGAHPERPTRYTQDAALAAHPNYRVTMMFDPPKTLMGRQLCAGETVASVPNEQGKVNVLMAFCQKDVMLAESWGWVKKVEGPNDPRLGRLIHFAVRHLFQAAK
jgi:hypothetical protein